MRKLSVLRCGDQLGWAYNWVSLEHERYSCHTVKYARHDQVDLSGVDVIYIHGPDISNYHATDLPLEAINRGIRVVGGYSGNPEYWSPAEKRTYSAADLIVAISPQTYAFCKFHYTNIPVVFMPESIDAEFFKPPAFGVSLNGGVLYLDWKPSSKPDRFVVGWAGGIHKLIKRAHLLNELSFPVVTKSDWFKQRNTGGSGALDGMVDFYRSIDVLVVTSLSECQPRVVMEAMACGLPVVATDVGSMRMLLDPEWIVTVLPESATVSAINERLHRLCGDQELRERVGKRNREHVDLCWSWQLNSEIWDTMFAMVCDGHAKSVEQISSAFLKSRDLGETFTGAARDYYHTHYPGGFVL